MAATIPKLSPFKLLRSYEKEDIGHYFGRDRETRQLYDALMRSKFMMVYGASGTGKTSLIQCGLQSMFSPRDWLPILLRRDTNFLASIHDQLYQRYLERFAAHQKQQQAWNSHEPAPEPEQFGNLRDLIKALFNLSYVPIYLILDQFEEIFTVGNRAEQDEFFQALKDLNLFAEDLFCKVIIVTREEYIAHFYRYENLLPFLFEYRFRVEKMREEQLMQVVEGLLMTPYPGYPPFALQAGASQQILYNLTDERGEVDLTTLQVYLDRLYQEERERAGDRDQILIDKALIGENKLTDVLSNFLDQQVAKVFEKLIQQFPEQRQKSGENAPLRVLFQMVTSQGTKQNRNAVEIFRELEKGKNPISLPVVQGVLEAFASPESRILNTLRFAKTDAKRYEIMHDRLAALIFSKFNADELRRREAEDTIRNKIKRFQEASTLKEQKQEYLSIGEIELVNQSLNTERLEDMLKNFFQESRTYHVNRRRRERRITQGAVIAAVVFLGVAIAAGLFYQQAQAARLEANNNLETAQENLRQFQEARYNEIVKRAEGYIALKSLKYALWEYEQAKIYWNDTLFGKDAVDSDTLQPLINQLVIDIEKTKDLTSQTRQ